MKNQSSFLLFEAICFLSKSQWVFAVGYPNNQSNLVFQRIKNDYK